MTIPTYFDMNEIQINYQTLFKYCSECGAVIAGNNTNHFMSKNRHDAWHMEQVPTFLSSAELMQAKFDIGVLQQRITKLEEYEDTLLEMIAQLEDIMESSNG